MVSKRTRFAWAAAAGLGALGLVLAASAAEVSPPNAGPAAGHQQVKIDPNLLDKYAGFYLLGEQAVITVKPEGDHLSTQLTGQTSVQMFPESRDTFFARVVDAQMSFELDPAGRVTTLVLHQNGRDSRMPRVDTATAQAVAARTQARVKAQIAAPGSDAAVRKLEESLAAGTPDYADMSPALAEATRSQLPHLQSSLAPLGPIQEVRFLGVNPQGVDVYNLRHANGITRWLIALGPDGKITTAWVAPGP